MTLVSDIVRGAFRESNLIAISASPTQAEQDEALALLNRFLASVYGDEAGEQLMTIDIGRNNVNRPSGYPWYDGVPPGNDWVLPPNTRMALNLTSAQTVYLDPNPTDGQRFGFIDISNNLVTYPLTVIGNGRTIGGSATQVFNTNGLNREYMYREDLGDWRLVSPLLITDAWPFPIDFDDMFIVGLSMRLNPRHAVQADPQSTSTYQRLLRSFTARYRQHRQVGSELAILRLPSNYRYRYLDNNTALAAFNSGYAYPYSRVF